MCIMLVGNMMVLMMWFVVRLIVMSFVLLVIGFEKFGVVVLSIYSWLWLLVMMFCMFRKWVVVWDVLVWLIFVFG